MKLLDIVIHGYGRFSRRNLTLEPGLQVVVGPNERGKSTLRSFLVDMLYGQAEHDGVGGGEEHRDLRIPWEDPAVYGGRLRYALGDENAFTIIRDFHAGAPATQVLEGDKDITPALRGAGDHEPLLMEKQLGLSRAVFVGTATISHLTLEGLASGEALERIRQKLLSLADTGYEGASAIDALNALDAFIEQLGRPGQTHAPLPSAQARYHALERERLAVLRVRESLVEFEKARGQLREREGALKAKRKRLEDEKALIGFFARAKRLETAQGLSARIDEVTQECFALGGARSFPAELTAAMQRSETLYNTARMQLTRTREDLEEVRRQLAMGDLASKGAPGSADIDAALEDQLAAALTAADRLRERLADVATHAVEAQTKVDEAHAKVAEYPDFSRIAPDPVAWLTQLSSSFDVAVRTRNEECGQRTIVRQEVEQRRARVAPYEQLFGGLSDFPERARTYEETRRLQSEEHRALASNYQTLQNQRDEIEERLPGFRFLAGGLGISFVLLAIAFLVTQVVSVLLPASLTLIGALYFVGNLLWANKRLATINAEVSAVTERQEVLRVQEEPGGDDVIEQLMRQERCESVRELEARFDAYTRQSAELAARQEVLDGLEKRAAEAEDRVTRMLARFKETFLQVGEQVEAENDVKKAAGHAVARYQDYREQKGRLMDWRAQHERLRNEMRRISAELEAARAHEAEVAGKVRAIMREQGFDAESEHENITAALRAYRQRAVSVQERRGRDQVLREKESTLAAQLEREEGELSAAEAELSRVLGQGGVESVEAWHVLAGEAARYKELSDRRAALEAQFATVLDGEDFNTLRAEVEKAGAATVSPAMPPSEIDEELVRIQDDERILAQEERRLQLEIADRLSGHRSLNEVEEELAIVTHESARMELDREAASHAMAIIEEIARDKHARIAPRLSAAASEYLAEITDGAYTEIRLERDFSVRVCVPGDGRVLEAPEKSLSKGTIDQVYLALRLALVQALSRTHEPLPMLLDDPFANYDDARLLRTMRLLARIAQQNQTVLFTCREDVARAAEQVNATIVRL
jgi:uncharacterized protein YhaN